MEKVIGAEELVYATITGLVAQKASISIQFNHLSGKAADHCYSLDKDKYTNCYRQLEVGQSYIIVTKHVGKRRWVWSKCLPVTKKEMNMFREIAGLIPTEQQMLAAVQAVKDFRDPPLPPSLADLLQF